MTHPFLSTVVIAATLAAGSRVCAHEIDVSSTPGSAPAPANRQIAEPVGVTQDETDGAPPAVPRGVRYGLAGLGGAAGAIAGAALLGVVGWASCGFGQFMTEGPGPCANAVSIGILLGVAGGLPLGVHLTAGLLGGSGRFLPTLAGVMVGWLAFVSVIIVAGSTAATVVHAVGGAGRPETVFAAIATAALAAPVVGGVVGYELSSAPSPTATVRPVVSMSQHQTTVGASISF